MGRGTLKFSGRSSYVCAFLAAALLLILPNNSAAQSLNLVSSTSINGTSATGSDRLAGIAVDPNSGEIFGVGTVNQSNATGTGDEIFIGKYDSSLVLIASHVVVGAATKEEDGFGIALGNAGEVFVVGKSSVAGIGDQIYIARFDQSLNLVSSVTFGTVNNFNSGEDVFFDSSKNLVYVVGVTSQGASSGDVWIGKLDTSLNLISSTTFDGGGFDNASQVIVAEGNLYIAANTSGDVLVLKYVDSTLTFLSSVTFDGSAATGADFAHGIALHSNGDLYVVGTTSETGTDIGMWFGRLNSSLVLVSSAIYTETGNDSAEGVVVDGAGNLVIAGRINNPGSSPKIWLANYTPSLSIISSHTHVGSDVAEAGALDVEVAGDGAVFVSGSVSETGQGANLWLGEYTGAEGTLKIWQGGGGDNLASNPANWVGGFAPKTSNNVIFGSTGSTLGVNWDIAGLELANMTMEVGYSSTVHINVSSFETKNFEISGGTFAAESSTITVFGNFKGEPGGTFIAGTSTVTFKEDGFVRLKNGAFNHVVVDLFSGPNFLRVDGATVTINGNLTISGGTVDLTTAAMVVGGETIIGGSFGPALEISSGTFDATGRVTVAINAGAQGTFRFSKTDGTAIIRGEMDVNEGGDFRSVPTGGTFSTDDTLYPVLKGPAGSTSTIRVNGVGASLVTFKVQGLRISDVAFEFTGLENFVMPASEFSGMQFDTLGNGPSNIAAMKFDNSTSTSIVIGASEFDAFVSTNIHVTASMAGSTITVNNSFGAHGGSAFDIDLPSDIIQWNPETRIFDGGVSADASDPSNWIGNVLPLINDSVAFDANVSAGTAMNWNITVGGGITAFFVSGSFAPTITVSSQLVVTSEINISDSSNVDWTFTSDSTLNHTISKSININNGVMKIQATTVTVNAFFNVTKATLTLESGARLQADVLTIFSGSPNALFKIEAGGVSPIVDSTGPAATIFLQLLGDIDILDGDFRRIGLTGLTLFASANIVNMSSFTITGPLQPGTTAIDLGFATRVATLTAVNFSAGNIAVNVNATGLSGGSAITMNGALGPFAFSTFEADPGNFVEWNPDGVPANDLVFTGLFASAGGAEVNTSLNNHEAIAAIAIDTSPANAAVYAVVLSTTDFNSRGDTPADAHIVKYSPTGVFQTSVPLTDHDGSGHSIAITETNVFVTESDENGTFRSLTRLNRNLALQSTTILSSVTVGSDLIIAASPVEDAIFLLANAGTGDSGAKIIKFDANNGAEVVRTTYSADGEITQAVSMTVDSNGSVIVAVSTQGPAGSGLMHFVRFDQGLTAVQAMSTETVTTRDPQLTTIGTNIYVTGPNSIGDELFVRKLDNSFNLLAAATQTVVASEASDQGAIVGTPAGDIYVINTASPTRTYSITRYDSNLVQASSTTFVGSNGDGHGLGVVATAVAGTVLAAGTSKTSSTDADGIIKEIVLPAAPGGGGGVDPTGPASLVLSSSDTFNGVLSSSDGINGISVYDDGSDDILATGFTFEATGGKNIWVARYNVNNVLIASASFNGSGGGADEGSAIVGRSNGEIYVAGMVTEAGQGENVFVARYNSSLVLIASATLDGSASGNDFLEDGWFEGSYFHVAGVVDNAPARPWVAKYDTNLVLVSSAVLDLGSTGKAANAITVSESNGDIFVGGENNVDTSNIFIARLDSNFVQLSSMSLAGPAAGPDAAQSLDFMPGGDLVASGFVFNTGNGADIWVGRFNPSSLVIVSSAIYVGSPGNDKGFDVFVDGSSNIYVAANEASGVAGIWVGRFDENLALSTYTTVAGNLFDAGHGVAVTSGAVFVGGVLDPAGAPQDAWLGKFTNDGPSPPLPPAVAELAIAGALPTGLTVDTVDNRQEGFAAMLRDDPTGNLYALVVSTTGSSFQDEPGNSTLLKNCRCDLDVWAPKAAARQVTGFEMPIKNSLGLSGKMLRILKILRPAFGKNFPPDSIQVGAPIKLGFDRIIRSTGSPLEM
ncbi:MAG: hypothetical protein COB53_07890 [Elusimicrobia bacterium]|nr:MAG: hypothetical protein COB53_07890 [Elusimicrobiota bacterium]